MRAPAHLPVVMAAGHDLLGPRPYAVVLTLVVLLLLACAVFFVLGRVLARWHDSGPRHALGRPAGRARA